MPKNCWSRPISFSIHVPHELKGIRFQSRETNEERCPSRNSSSHNKIKPAHFNCLIHLPHSISLLCSLLPPFRKPLLPVKPPTSDLHVVRVFSMSLALICNNLCSRITQFPKIMLGFHPILTTRECHCSCSLQALMHGSRQGRRETRSKGRQDSDKSEIVGVH